MALFSWVRYGSTQGVPIWAQALIFAERWGGDPEEIMRRKGGVKWAARVAALDRAREKSAKMDRK